jgi:SAM-dependent methyltransferase
MGQKNVKDTELGTVLKLIKWITQWTLPSPVRDWLGTRLYGREYSPPPGWVRMGSLRRVTPINWAWGCGRGLPIDRYYIEKHLTNCSSDIHGHVLEVGDSRYTRSYGGNRVTKSDVLHVEEGNPEATIVADISTAHQIPSDTFDCIILAQTLHLIYDVRPAIKTLFRILKPGGVVLVTFPGISQISHQSEQGWANSWFWSFTVNSAHLLFEEVFPAVNVKIVAYGNVLAAIAFLHGLASEELCQKELDHCDPDYQVLITVRAVKPELKQ